MRVYLDNAATTPVAPEVVEAMIPVLRDTFGNPSSTHSYGRNAKALLETSRRTVAKHLNCASSEVIFTSGGTEADNMAIHTAVTELGVKRIITSSIEHHAVVHAADAISVHEKIELVFLNLDSKGNIDLTQLESLLKDGKPTLVTLMHANNEIATMIPLKKIAQMCRQNGAYFHSDTVQTMAHFPFDLSDLDIDFITCAAHKFHGPKGVGFIYVSSNAKIHPFITGGAQERNMRGGTENVYGIVGLTKALEKAYAHLDEEMAHISSLKKYMIEQLKANIPGIQFNGDAEGNSLYTVLNTSFPPSPIGEMLLFKLDIAGISVSGGSACSSGSDVGSHVLKALNTDRNRAAVRFSFAKQNTKAEVDKVIAALVEMLTATVKSN